ncbi:LysR substrate-binding domain-containing protein [Methylobacterium sp. J-026]|uniref:LysR family transcriptional regulator n=1 Tax=Methylobacterium sp. J-026 TaxID=2836624 RepID=UPI001FBAFFE1|nr:LysR family transcriptional regulator [Methylobacterium sp. J-026]MCJ2135119.1 LysR substrate-binding domain-containing protein [Methylobacterium sp. J-026]
MLDDLNELRTFRAILTEGSLSAAARRLGVTLAVVSKRLATLERRVGVRLIHRTTRALSATEEGSRLLIDVERALEAIESGEERLAGSRDEPAGTLRVSAPIAFGRRCVVPVIGDLARRYPRLAVCLELDDRLADLVGEGLDVTIRIGGLTDSSAMMRKLTDNRRILVASPAYLDAAGRPATPEEAVGHTFLRYGTSVEPWHLSGPGGVTVNLAATGRLRVDDGDAVHDWGLAGLGIMLKSQVDVAADLATGQLERVLPGWDGGDAPIVALYPSGRNLPLKTRVLLDALEHHVVGALDKETMRPTPHPRSAKRDPAEATAARTSALRHS